MKRIMITAGIVVAALLLVLVIVLSIIRSSEQDVCDKGYVLNGETGECIPDPDPN